MRAGARPSSARWGGPADRAPARLTRAGFRTADDGQAPDSGRVGTTGAGLRIATQPDAEQASLEVSVAESPAETDQVVSEAGARVFVEADAVPLLDDKQLDAEIEGTRVGFMLTEQPVA
jgi:iron-sulfur cluster assembly protein